MLRSTTKSLAGSYALAVQRRPRADAVRLREIIEEHRSDAVFVHTEDEHAMAAAVLKRVKRGQLVRRIRAGGALLRTPRVQRLEVAWPTRYLFTTEGPPADIARSGAPAPLRAELGVELPAAAMPQPADAYAVLACIATQEAVRRATQVVRTAALLATRHPQLRLRIVGSAASDPDLHVLANALGLAGRVDWFPQGSREGDVLAGAAAGWVVADGDDAGLGVLHLMAQGIIPLAERTPVTSRYFTDGIHGVQLARLEPPMMAAETTVLLADAARRGAMAGAARARVEKEFTLRAMLAGFEAAARTTRVVSPTSTAAV